ncbi:MAG: hypothetical protein K5829_14410 [Treponema sp.]|nr:hypothetical protein [Treponema sp.]
MKSYEFRLVPAFSLYCGVAVGWQKGSAVMFVTERVLKDEVKLLLQEAFVKYVHYVRGCAECPKEFFNEIKVSFLCSPRMTMRRYVFNSLRGKYEKTMEV